MKKLELVSIGVSAWQKIILGSFLAKYELDGLNKRKNDISKYIAKTKKESKGKTNVDKEIAESKEVGVLVEK